MKKQSTIKKGDKIFDNKKQQNAIVTKRYKPSKGSALEGESFVMNIVYDDGTKAINMPFNDRFTLSPEIVPEKTETVLSDRSQDILGRSLEEYNSSTPEQKIKLINLVKNQLSRNTKGVDAIGMGLDKDMVAAGEEFLKQVESNISDLLTQAITDVIALHPARKYGDLDLAEAKMLYDLKDKEIGRVYGEPTTAKESVYDLLDNMDYIQDYDSEDGFYKLTEKGKEFIAAVNARIDTLKGVESGTDLFPEDVAVAPLEKTYSNIKSCLISEGDDEQQYIFEGKEIIANGEKWNIVGFFKYGCILEHIKKNKLSTKKKNEKLSFNEIIDMFKQNDIVIPGIGGIIELNHCIKILEKCIDIIDLKERVVDSIKIEPPAPIFYTEGLNVGDEGMWHGAERRILGFDDLGNVEIIQVGTDRHTKVSIDQFKKEFAKFPEENKKEFYNKHALPKDGSGIHINMPAIGHLKEDNIILKYQPDTFGFDIFKNESHQGSITEKEVMSNLENGMYVITKTEPPKRTSDFFELGTPAIYKGDAGEIVMRDEKKGILLYPNKNYSGPDRIFIIPDEWSEVLKFSEETASLQAPDNDTDFSEAISTLDMLLQDEPDNSEWLEAKETLQMLQPGNETPEAEKIWNKWKPKMRQSFLNNNKLSEYKGARLAKYNFLADEIKEKLSDHIKEKRGDVNKKVYAALLKEARADKEWAKKKEKEVGREWKSGSEMSRQMLTDRLDKTADQLAMESYDYLKLRAHAVSKSTNYPIDKPSKEKWEKLSGEKIK